MAPEDLGPKIFQVNADAPVSAHPYVSMTSPFLRSHAFSAVHFNRATQLPPCNLTMYLALYTTVPCRSRRDLTFREAFARRSYRGHHRRGAGSLSRLRSYTRCLRAWCKRFLAAVPERPIACLALPKSLHFVAEPPQHCD